jgi:tripartite-type tricarboxylate transporter receptor subunit TctC
MRKLDYSRRQFLWVQTSALAIPWIPAVCVAQQPPALPCPGEGCPNGIVIPFAPGGTTDKVGRALAASLAQKFGAAVMVENRAGAGGLIGASTVAKGPTDGSKVLLATATVLNSGVLNSKAKLQLTADFSPIAMVGSSPLVLLVPVSGGLKSMAELRERLRAVSGTTYSSPGVGTLGHLAALALLDGLRTTATHIPYRGSAPALAGLLSGETVFGFFDQLSAREAISSGRALAIGTGARIATEALPRVAPIRDQGVAEFEAVDWYGLFAAKGVSAQSIGKWRAAVESARRDPQLRGLLTSLGVDVSSLNLDVFNEFLSREQSRTRQTIARHSVTID